MRRAGEIVVEPVLDVELTAVVIDELDPAGTVWVAGEFAGGIAGVGGERVVRVDLEAEKIGSEGATRGVDAADGGDLVQGDDSAGGRADLVCGRHGVVARERLRVGLKIVADLR